MCLCIILLHVHSSLVGFPNISTSWISATYSRRLCECKYMFAGFSSPHSSSSSNKECTKIIYDINRHGSVCVCVCMYLYSSTYICLQQKLLLSFLVMLIASSFNSSWYFDIRCLCLYFVVYIIPAAQRMWFDNSLQRTETVVAVERDRWWGMVPTELLWMQSVVTDETNGHGHVRIHSFSQSVKHETRDECNVFVVFLIPCSYHRWVRQWGTIQLTLQNLSI